MFNSVQSPGRMSGSRMGVTLRGNQPSCRDCRGRWKKDVVISSCFPGKTGRWGTWEGGRTYLVRESCRYLPSSGDGELGFDSGERLAPKCKMGFGEEVL